MPPLKIITAMTDDHITQLMALYRAEWWSEWRTLEDVKTMLAHCTFIFVVTDPEEKILYGFARVLSDHVYRATIFDVIVAPGFRGQGIGSWIVSAIKAHPVIQKIKSLELYCRDDNVSFYEKHGFTRNSGRNSTQRMSIEK